MRSIVLIHFILSLVAGRSTPVLDTAKWFVKCMAECAILPIIPVVSICAVKCMADCIPVASSPMDLNRMDTHYFCKLGCTTYRCTKLSTKKDLVENKVETCGNTCDQTCMKA
ncbi:thionin-like protein 2 [Cucumis melo var. makuwa]|uniref:Thionin-like protein 2 n=1 Tax=Cucumis melo var. makuwa TaxID=1194695 RepID=A0A5D3BCH5_CUCMM|nr:thionin-like protein 2 [Cucumis melo var. makuwa]TYJ97540.1 thionin-like protein 2 [Cucumis melo var. makuwa]